MSRGRKKGAVNVGRPFQKGHDPRRQVGGKPILPPEVKLLARETSVEALQKIIDIMRTAFERYNTKRDHREGTLCKDTANLIIERGYGKAHTPIAVESQLERKSDDEVRALVKEAMEIDGLIPPSESVN